MESYFKDLLLENSKFKFDPNRSNIVFDTGDTFKVSILASNDNQRYFFLRIEDENQPNDLYFGLFNLKCDGYLTEIETQGKNREALNTLSNKLKSEVFSSELLVNDKVLVLALKFYICKDWHSIVYELDDFKDNSFKNNPSDFIY